MLADQFRDGNVPAGMDLLAVLKEAISALPPTVRLVRFRSDSAAYVHELLDWCRKEVPGRPRIEFAISADMTEELRAAIQALPEEAWKPLRKVTDQGLDHGRKEWAEVEFVPTASFSKKEMKPDRYLAIRIRPPKENSFRMGIPITTLPSSPICGVGMGKDCLRWQRERCGTVEKVMMF